MATYKARIERPSKDWHAMEIWLDADNIIDAANDIMNVLSPLGVCSDQVSKLVEVSE